MKHAKCGDDDQNVQAASNEGLHDHQAENEAWPRQRSDCGEGKPRFSEDVRLVRPRDLDERAVDADAGERDRAEGHDHGRSREDDANRREGSDEPGSERTDERAEALNRRGRSVRGDQLLGRARERRKQRLQRRPHERRRQPDDSSKGVDEARNLRECCARRTDERATVDEQHDEEEPLATEPVGKRRSHRRNDRRRQQTNEAREPNRRSPARPICEDTEAYEVRPLRDDRGAPRNLRSPHVPIPQSQCDRRHRSAKTEHRPIERLSRAGGKNAPASVDYG